MPVGKLCPLPNCEKTVITAGAEQKNMSKEICWQERGLVAPGSSLICWTTGA